jgi:hypothetical protein
VITSLTGVTTPGLLALVAAVLAGAALVFLGTRVVWRRNGSGSSGPARRFNGERAYVARGGASIGETHTAWPMAELAVDSSGARLRSRPVGLFDELAVRRDEVSGVIVRRGALGNGIAFADPPPQLADVVFWPTDATQVLDALRERGWRVPAKI